jgi:ComF family protein
MRKIFSFLLPYTCILCHGKSDRQLDLCSHCERELPFIKHACPRCGIEMEINTQICGNCLKNPPPFDDTVTLFHYENPISKIIMDLKFQQKLVNAKILGELMAKHLNYLFANNNYPKPDCIIPVPLSAKRLRERGFNQALEIAKPIAKHLNIPIDINNCKRTRHTEAQAIIPANKRKSNIKNAFKIIKTINAKHVAIVDDVVTTGNTVIELSKTLQQAGIERISIWCCARTLSS